MTRRTSLAALLLLAIILATAACAGPVLQFGPDTPDQPDNRHPFSTSVESTAGTTVGWNGFEDGHVPGASSQLTLKLENETGALWNGAACVELASSYRLLGTLAAETFAVQPGDGLQSSIDVPIPGDLEAGSYAFVLVAHRPTGAAVEVIPIEVSPAPANAAFPELISVQPDVVDAAVQACPQAGDQG